jgi:hypothetical protein
MPEERKTDTPETDGQEFVPVHEYGHFPPYPTVSSAFARKLERERDEARQEAKSKGIVLDAIHDELESVTGKSLPIAELVGELVQQRDAYRAALQKIHDIDEERDDIYSAMESIVSVAHNALNGHE